MLGLRGRKRVMSRSFSADRLKAGAFWACIAGILTCFSKATRPIWAKWVKTTRPFLWAFHRGPKCPLWRKNGQPEGAKYSVPPYAQKSKSRRVREGGNSALQRRRSAGPMRKIGPYKGAPKPASAGRSVQGQNDAETRHQTRWVISRPGQWCCKYSATRRRWHLSGLSSLQRRQASAIRSFETLVWI